MSATTALQDALDRADTKDAALALVLARIEKGMQLLDLESNPGKKKDRRDNVKALLAVAESIKATGQWRAKHAPATAGLSSAHLARATSADPTSTRKLSKAEQIIILKSSVVNGLKFPPWQNSPTDSDFALGPDGQLYTDSTVFSLSDDQLAAFDGWKRPAEALPPPTKQAFDQVIMPPTLDATGDIDVVQDAATDCSVVASICTALARRRKGHAYPLGKVFFPYDSVADKFIMSVNGRYIARLYFNGSFRRVEIDDRLPVSKTNRILHCVDRNNPALLWPALIEKLYLKVRGGYDFPGSNSSTDLWILFGWIPEQIFLHSAEVYLAHAWDDIWDSYRQGDVMITLGTGHMSVRAEKETGLASEHDYAVLDTREEQGQKLMLIKNPWCEGSTWRGSRRRNSSVSGGQFSSLAEDAVPSPRDLLNSKSQLSPGTFWMDIHSIEQHFESMYLNWSPTLLPYKEDIHFDWDLRTTRSSCSLVHNPQLAFSIAKGGRAWLLVSRHFRDDRRKLSSSQQASAFISLSVYMNNHRRLLKEHAQDRAPFVDSYQTLLRLSDLSSGTSYTAVVEQDGLGESQYSFTLSVFADSAVTLDHATKSLAFTTSIAGEWDELSAGGNPSSVHFAQNPQYVIVVKQPTSLALLLDTPDKHVAVNVKLCFSNGRRMHSIRNKDVLGDSKEYRPGCALATTRLLDPGAYTAICSTFEGGQTSPFTLHVDSDTVVDVRKLAPEGSGRLKTAISEACFDSGQQAMAILLLPQRLTKFVAVVKSGHSAGAQSTERSMIRARVLQGNSFDHKVIAVSSEGEYQDSVRGVRTEEIDLSPEGMKTADLWLVVERSLNSRRREEETFAVEFRTESRNAVQTGDWQTWEV